MNKRFALLLPMLVLILVGKCVGQTQPEGLFFVDKFELGKATISDVQAYFGPSKLYALERGDGADRAVCYSNGTAKSSPTVIFETGALGGWKEITAYRLTSQNGRRCVFTATRIAMLSTGNGLHLFAARDVALRSINAPSTTSSSKVLIEQVYQRDATPVEAARIRSTNPDATQLAFDVVDTIEVRFKDNVVDDLYVKRLVSY
jgi:hypothetical protein